MEVFSLKTYDKILSFENDFYKELYKDWMGLIKEINLIANSHQLLQYFVK
jgi:hypothetical protein